MLLLAGDACWLRRGLFGRLSWGGVARWLRLGPVGPEIGLGGLGGVTTRDVTAPLCSAGSFWDVGTEDSV